MLNTLPEALVPYLDVDARALHRLRMSATSSPRTEADRAGLIRAIAQAGDRAAFIALFAFYAPRIKAQAMRFGLTGDAAEDVAQDAMLSLWRRAHQFDETRGTASGWVFSIATNARIDRMRRDKPLAKAVDIDENDPLMTSDPVESGPDSVRLAGLLQTLPEEQRRILHLSFFADLPHGDIARKLGLPLGTVKSRIRLAIGKLRLALKDEA